jgi:hypothetical protein
MRRHVIALLLAVNGALLVLLLAMWVTPQGTLRNVAWRPPAPIQPDFSAPVAANAEMNLAGFVASLERPLFSPNRLPPPVKAAGAAAAPVDPLSNIRLHGIYAGSGTGGIIASVDGKSRRIRLNENVGEWTVKEIKDRDVTFVRGGESRVIHLAAGQGKADEGAGAAVQGAAQSGAGQGARAAAPLSKQQILEERRARRMRNQGQSR